MFRIESYVTPILLSYVDKYVKDFKPADAQVSLWAGGVALHNLVLKADVLQQEVALPFTLVSGRIHELLIQVPWTKIMSEPIVVTIDTIECVLSLNPPASNDDAAPPDSPSPRSHVVEAPPGYMQALVRRIVSNIALRVHHLIVKYVQDDIVMSLNVKHLAVDCAGVNWEPSFADIDQNQPVIRRLVVLDDLTLCLDRADSDGKIRFYQEPLLYRCHLDLRVLTKLVSANTRRARNLSIQMQSSKLAWGVTSDQLTLLLRLIREKTGIVKPPTPAPRSTNSTQSVPLNPSSLNTAEPTRSESWSEWAWSWLPTWMDRDGVEEAPTAPAPIPVNFAAFLDDVSLVFKVMENESNARKRARPVLELNANYAAIKSYICAPTVTRVHIATKNFTMMSKGKCVCGHVGYKAMTEEPTVYLHKIDDSEPESTWTWPEDLFTDVEVATAVDEYYRGTPDITETKEQRDSETQMSDLGVPEEPTCLNEEHKNEAENFWTRMAPLLFIEYSHERMPPSTETNPYDSPPVDFEYSDWVEESIMKITIKPVELYLTMGLLHRFSVLKSICQELPPIPIPEITLRVLTVEECEALTENLPQRRVTLEVLGLRVRCMPWNHSPSERPAPPLLYLDMDSPKTVVVVNGPLYPIRVCSAACQMPEDVSVIWHGARLHVTVNTSVAFSISSPTDKQTRPCARAEIKAVSHTLLNSQLFTKKDCVFLGYSIKIVEANVCGSFARLQAALQVPLSLYREHFSKQLRYSSLAFDALNDEESVAIDFTLEDMVLRGYKTCDIRTYIVILQSAKATALHEPKKGEVKQAWLFSAPDAPTSSPYLRFAVQWCLEPVPYSIEYAGIWTEPTAVAVDPLFIAWLAYKPVLKNLNDSTSQIPLSKSMSSTQYFMRRKATPPSSSGRGVSKSGSGADMIHMRTRSAGSSEKAESKDTKRTPNQEKTKPLWSSERMLAIHERLRRMYVNVELGLTLVYITMKTASALECETIRDAMEWHASSAERVLALSLGRIFLFSSLITKHFWHEINHDGPTLVTENVDARPKDAFPWRMRLADVSCYTLEVSPTERQTRDKSAAGLRSQLRTVALATPKTVLELVTTTVTLSVVTKSLQYKTLPKPEPKAKKETPKAGEAKLKYFKGGHADFKPTTLKEFVRGPAQRKKSNPEVEVEKKREQHTEPLIATGPLVSVGVNIHADTPPLIIRLEQYQVRVVSAAVHCFAHIAALLQPTVYSKHAYTSFGGSSHRSLGRSVSELEQGDEPQSEDTLSENQSELISIFEAKSALEGQIDVKTFFWFQWVVSRVNIVVATEQVKLAFDIDDIISTIDLQNHYNQLKIKVASASVRYFQKSASDDWTAGSLGGRVLEAREPTNAKEDNHFLSITITQARISNLPASWKQELHPKLLEEKSGVDSMWEIYATLAPLEAVIQPEVLGHIHLLINEMSPRSFCPLNTENSSVVARPGAWQWPFLYVSAGGLRLLVTRQHEGSNKDDTFIFVMGKASISPHPENPICRRAVNAGSDWTTHSGGFEGRQYEILVRHVGVRTARFRQLVNQEQSEAESLKGGTGGENPAVKWTQPIVAPEITPVLHSVDLGCVIAPAFYNNHILLCGPAIEFNLVSDCALEFSIDQLVLAARISTEMRTTLRDAQEAMVIYSDVDMSSMCPYAPLLMTPQTADVGTDELSIVSEGTIDEPQPLRAASETIRSVAADSGVDSVTPSTNRRLDDGSGQALKKTVSIAFFDHSIGEASEYLEIFITMGIIEVSLYTVDDNSPVAESLRPPEQFQGKLSPEEAAELPQPRDSLDQESKQSSVMDDRVTPAGSARSLTENVRNLDIGKTKLELPFPHARRSEGNLPLLHLTLYQPNLYYWRKKTQKTLQVSLFNAWLGLGAGQYPGLWHEELFCTARGVSDPVTDIRPALATMKLVAPCIGSQSISNVATRGTIRLDIERPVLFEISYDRLRRLKIIGLLLKEKLGAKSVHVDQSPPDNVNRKPVMYKLKQMLVNNFIESMTIQTTQVAVSGWEGVVGWDSASIQVAAGGRPERLLGRGLLTALVVSTGPPGDARHVLLHPLVVGLDFQATWEAWRKAEGGIAAREPMVRVTCELDQLTCDVRPAELTALARMKAKLIELMTKPEGKLVDDTDDSSAGSKHSIDLSYVSTIGYESRPSIISVDAPEDHFYKDDLRSGAFKIVSGGQLPMAYQVTLHNEAVSWRYPHPRAITRLVAFPLPGQYTETQCVLELYDSQLNRWDPHTYFKIPVGEPIEMLLYAAPPDAVFSVMWRYRACTDTDRQYHPYEFDINKFMPRADPMQIEQPPEAPPPKDTGSLSAEQLSGVVRVDSCFSPRVAPRVRFVTRVARLAVHLHNQPPTVSSNSTSLEGYYVSKPLMRSHRVLTLAAKDLIARAQLVSPAGALLLLNMVFMSDCMDCTTGTMEPLIEEFHMEGGLSLATQAKARARAALSHVYVALHMPRLKTLHALARDWQEALEQNLRGRSNTTEIPLVKTHSKYEMTEVTAAALEGLVSLWIHNSCAYALRVGQECTDEVVPLGSGASLAYRWRCPRAPKKLHFSIAGPSADWHWSASIPFTAGSHRVRLHESGEATANMNAYLYIKTEEIGARKSMHLSGRLCLANMLRINLHYKVRGHSSDDNQWRTLCSGEISAETLGKSVICGVDAEMALKIKFVNQETGWSGDIPLRECPKENVPWLVKVPCESEQQPYMSVWCRVVRARSDGRILATIWPLYVLYSHLPLDADVSIETEGAQSSPDVVEETSNKLSVLVQAPGRGTCTHLLVPGTTAARHTLYFQYSNIDCSVTHDAVALHYGVTDTSVFEKRPPVASIDEVMQETADWLKRSGHDAMSPWPYSIVTKHWSGEWQPALMQPRCDVVVRYRAVRAGGGCSLEVLLCPVVLLCNAAPIALTLRAHDAAPLCKLQPGTAISTSSAILKKSFFISVEMGRETFVSGELSISGAELGRYGTPPPGRVALDRPAELAIQCNHKVALLTMYYEIKEDINILGMSSTYVLVNSMDTNISISAIAVPSEASKETILRPTTFKVVEPTRDGSAHGMSLCRFWVWGRWRGSDPEDLRLYLFVTLPSNSGVTRPTPIRLGHPPVRRAIALTDGDDNSIPVVVTQVKHEGRWVVRVAHDPCPQHVVHNRTSVPLAVAQPARSQSEPGTSKVVVQQECLGTKWFCTVGPGAVTHYSTPLHCLRFPPLPNTSPTPSSIAFLTFAKSRENADPDWCEPIAATDGEQLLQLSCGMTVKLRVRTHPHSTELELRDVDQHDISASDIRKRLLGAFDSTIFNFNNRDVPETLERIDADDKLLGPQVPSAHKVAPPSVTIAETVEPSPTPTSGDRRPSALVILSALEQDETQASQRTFKIDSPTSVGPDIVFKEVSDPEWDETASWSACDRIRVVAASIAVALAVTSDTRPLIALHLERAALLVKTDARRTKMTISAGDIQIDNLQYESGQFDFGVVASTRSGGNDGTVDDEISPPLWSLFTDRAFTTKLKDPKALLKLTYDSWTVLTYDYRELTEIEISMGPLALYVEDLYVTSIAHLLRRVTARTDAGTDADTHSDDGRSLQRPLSLRSLHIHPLDLTLTLHTAVRMYIALDQSPLRLSAFKLHDAMTSTERLTHALTVHYLSAAILGAGWVVGGLELLGAPGALAARVGGARGGVRGVASAAAAALLRSLSAWAGSLARNLDLLAGDEEHARRAAAARRRPPASFMAGLAAGITNFAINILGAVGGLAHHPLVGVAVGESDSSATALRRGLLGALAKPLSATADLVAFAGHGLLSQTGWDPVPQPLKREQETKMSCGWRRDCVRWSFRLAELTAITGFQVLLNSTHLHLLLTHKFLVVADPDSERIVEMIDLKFCSIGPYQGQIIELIVTQKRQSKVIEARGIDEDDEYQISAAAMARVARYTGAEGTNTSNMSESRVLSLLPAPGYAYALHAALTAAVHNNADSHFPLL